MTHADGIRIVSELHTLVACMAGLMAVLLGVALGALYCLRPGKKCAKIEPESAVEIEGKRYRCSNVMHIQEFGTPDRIVVELYADWDRRRVE